MLGWLCLGHVAVIDKPLKPGPKGCLLQRNHNKIWDSRIRAVGLSAMNLNQTKSCLPGPKTWQRCAKPRVNEGIHNPNTQALWGQGEQGRDLWVEISLPGLWNFLRNARRQRKATVGWKNPMPITQDETSGPPALGPATSRWRGPALHLHPLGSPHFHLPGFWGGSCPASSRLHMAVFMTAGCTCHRLENCDPSILGSVPPAGGAG